MTLHVFNPEHDLALAFGGKYFTAPHAGRQLRADLGFLPVVWAKDGDGVLVGDPDNARYQARLLKGQLPNVEYVTKEDLRRGLYAGSPVDPWGWDAAVRHQTRLCQGPSSEILEAIRVMSNRRWAASHLGNTGTFCDSMAMLESEMSRLGQFVLKSPWSSSGRGVRYAADRKWCEAVLAKQGGVMIEPYYNKVKDFGMEFMAHPDGSVSYEGLSLFSTVKGFYTGNILAQEQELLKQLTPYIDKEELKQARDRIMSTMGIHLRGIYSGPFGVDMMIVRADDGHYQLCTCVELNLRRTMGHVAIAMTRLTNPDGMEPHRLMRVEYDGSHYHLRILNTYTNMLNTNLI